MKIKSLCSLVAITVVSTMFFGCTSTQVADLKDCGRFSLGMGLGLDATAKAGSLAKLGVGVVGSKTARIGHESREWSGTWAEDQYVWPYEWARRSDILERDEYLQGLSVMSAYTRDYYVQWTDDEGSIEVAYMIPIFEPPPQRKSAFAYGELTDMEVGFTFFLVSARLGINPLEIADAIAGIWDADPAGDDCAAKPKKCSYAKEDCMSCAKATSCGMKAARDSGDTGTDDDVPRVEEPETEDEIEVVSEKDDEALNPAPEEMPGE